MWQDVTSYSRGDRANVEPNAWEIICRGLDVCVHRLHGAPGLWFMSSRRLGIETRQLADADLELAKAEALRVARATVEGLTLAIEMVEEEAAKS